MEKSEEIAELAKGFVEFHKIVKQPKKDQDNPHFKSKYSSVDEIVKVIDEAAPEAGLSYTQWPTSTENGTGIWTMIMHVSGQYIIYDPLQLPAAKETAQAYGSSQTYARRYTLAAIFGLAAETDDDGNAASNTKTQSKPQGSQQKQQSKNEPKHESNLKPEDAKLTINQKSHLEEGAKALKELTGANVKDIYQKLNIGDVEGISNGQAGAAIRKLDSWIEQAKERQSKEKQEA